MMINLPNQITILRLGLALVFFGVLTMVHAEQFESQRAYLAASFWIFLAAALSDVLDGLLARSTGQVTSFGRIVDPVVDKVLICGAFIFLASPHFQDSDHKVNLSGVEPWMVVLILTRELIVSGIRSHSESAGKPFPADWLGKLKMFVQCLTVCVVLGRQAWFYESAEFATFARGCVWATAIVTPLSIIPYLQRGREFIFSREALSNSPAAAPSQRAGAPGTPPKSPPTARQPSGASA